MLLSPSLEPPGLIMERIAVPSSAPHHQRVVWDALCPSGTGIKARSCMRLCWQARDDAERVWLPCDMDRYSTSTGTNTRVPYFAQLLKLHLQSKVGPSFPVHQNNYL